MAGRRSRAACGPHHWAPVAQPGGLLTVGPASPLAAGPTRERPKSRCPTMRCLMRHRQTGPRLSAWRFTRQTPPGNTGIGFGRWLCHWPINPLFSSPTPVANFVLYVHWHARFHLLVCPCVLLLNFKSLFHYSSFPVREKRAPTSPSSTACCSIADRAASEALGVPAARPPTQAE